MNTYTSRTYSITIKWIITNLCKRRFVPKAFFNKEAVKIINRKPWWSLRSSSKPGWARNYLFKRQFMLLQLNGARSP